MHLTQDRADYCRGENFTVAQLSFRGGQTMRFLLPDEGTTLERLLADDTVVGGLMIYDMGGEPAERQAHLERAEV